MAIITDTKRDSRGIQRENTCRLHGADQDGLVDTIPPLTIDDILHRPWLRIDKPPHMPTHGTDEIRDHPPMTTCSPDEEDFRMRHGIARRWRVRPGLYLHA